MAPLAAELNCPELNTRFRSGSVDSLRVSGLHFLRPAERWPTDLTDDVYSFDRTRGNLLATSITTLAPKAREYGRDLSLAHKVIAVIMGVTSAALLLACLALVAYDTSTARTSDAGHRHCRPRCCNQQHSRHIVRD